MLNVLVDNKETLFHVFFCDFLIAVFTVKLLNDIENKLLMYM